MALYDNAHWLLSHIRHSFISSDGTGMCEAVIADPLPKHLFSEDEKYPQVEDSDDEADLHNSLENSNEWEFGNHRFRSPCPEKYVEEEEEKSEFFGDMHDRWQDDGANATEQEVDDMFERKEVKKNRKTGQSLLSLELEKCSLLPKNPFSEHAKWDGSCQIGIPTRTYRIFLTMLPPSERDYPVEVCILRYAKVSDLIGFTCWKYVMHNPNSTFKFKTDIREYGLFIAEDDGEVDWDFSSLDPRETVGKFGLAYLALVELTDRNVQKKSDTQNTVGSLAETVESIDEKAELEAAERFNLDLCAMESLLHETFRVSLLYKMRGKVEVVLSVSGDRIEVLPFVQYRQKSRGKTLKKPICYDVHEIVECKILDSKQPSRAIFRITYHSDDSSGGCSYKSNDFECDIPIAREVNKKVNTILKVKSSVLRKEYMEMGPKKATKKSGFNLWPRS